MTLLALPGPVGFIWCYMALHTMDSHIMDAKAHRPSQTISSRLV